MRRATDGCIVPATLSEMYDNSIQDLRKEDHPKKDPESDDVKLKEKVTEHKDVNESIFRLDNGTLTLLSYIAITIMLLILFPLSYWISLRVYNNLF